MSLCPPPGLLLQSPWCCLQLLCLMLLLTDSSSTVSKKVLPDQTGLTPDQTTQVNQAPVNCSSGCDNGTDNTDIILSSPEAPKLLQKNQTYTSLPINSLPPTTNAGSKSNSSSSSSSQQTQNAGGSSPSMASVSNQLSPTVNLPFNATTTTSTIGTAITTSTAPRTEPVSEVLKEDALVNPSLTTKIPSTNTTTPPSSTATKPFPTITTTALPRPLTVPPPPTSPLSTTTTKPPSTTARSMASSNKTTVTQTTVRATTNREGSPAPPGGSRIPAAPTPEGMCHQDSPTTRVSVVEVAGEALSKQLVDTASLLAVLLFGLLFLSVTLLVFIAQAYESYRRKDYTQVDYLINGMYTDSGI